MSGLKSKRLNEIYFNLAFSLTVSEKNKKTLIPGFTSGPGGIDWDLAFAVISNFKIDKDEK